MKRLPGALAFLVLLNLPVSGEDEERNRIISVIVEKAVLNKGERLYVDFMGQPIRAGLISADKSGLKVNIAGGEVPIPWSEISDRRLFQAARKLTPDSEGETLLLLLEFASPRPDLAKEKAEIELLLAEKFPHLITPEQPPAESAKGAATPDGSEGEGTQAPTAETVQPPPSPETTQNGPRGPHRTPGPFLRQPRGTYRGIYPGHPKIFIRGGDQPPQIGVSLSELRRRIKSSPWSRYTGRLGLHAEYGSFYSLPNLALKWLAMGDSSAADRAVSIMKRPVPRDNTTTDGDLTEAAAIAYDWLYNYAGFSEEDKETVRENLLDAGRRMLSIMRDHVFHTRPNAWASGALMAGLALYPEVPEGEKMALEAIKYWKDNLFPARRLMDGPWQNSMAYGRKYLTRSVFHAMSAWSSATGDDVWFQAARQDNWAERMLYVFIYACRPDYTYVTYGDFFSSFWTARTGSMCNVLDATQGTRNPYGQGFIAELERRYGNRGLEPHRAYYLVFLDPTVPARPKSELPLCEVFGPHSMGCCFMRSGWGPNDIFLFYKCGDYYGDHGHFDQGTFEIFYKKPLAVDSGSYTEGFSGPHRMNYTIRSVAHNTLVFPERGKDEEGGQRVFHQQGVRNPRALPPTCETGDILLFNDQPGYCHVLGDVARAYDRVKTFYRHFLYVKPNIVVIFDAVSLAPKYRRLWLYHYPTKAEISEEFFKVVNGGGGVAGQVLLPAQAEIRDVPGFTVGSREYPAENQASPDITGKGRVEVEPAGQTEPSTYFLVVLTIGDGARVKPVAARLEDRDNSFALTLGPKVFLFGKDGRSMQPGVPATPAAVY